jgi:hypothetical protein
MKTIDQFIIYKVQATGYIGFFDIALLGMVY